MPKQLKYEQDQLNEAAGAVKRGMGVKTVCSVQKYNKI